MNYGQDPFLGWLSFKKFPFNEKLTMHMLHYQEVRCTILSVLAYYGTFLLDEDTYISEQELLISILIKTPFTYFLIFLRLDSLSDHLKKIGKILSGIRMTILKNYGRKEKRV